MAILLNEHPASRASSPIGPEAKHVVGTAYFVRSAGDGQVFDLIPEVAGRYCIARKPTPLEVWKLNRQVTPMTTTSALAVRAGKKIVSCPFPAISTVWRRSCKI